MPHGDHPVVAQRRLYYNTGTEESVWNPVEHAERAHPMLWQTINSSRGPGIVSALPVTEQRRIGRPNDIDTQ